MIARLTHADSHRRNRPAFTLVEVLVALVLVSILSGMVMTAVRGVTLTAREARTRSIIAIIDTVIQEQYESYKYRPLPVEIPELTESRPPNILKFEVLTHEAARVRLNMIRDLQRMELPDRISDISSDINEILLGTEINRPATIVALAVRVLENQGPPPRFERDPDRSNREPFTVSWYTPTSLPNRFAAYRRLAKTSWTHEHESAECLYMIMATSFVGGAPALEQIPATNIGDLDGDGMPEILDGWGRPLGFIRWPIGYVDPELSVDTSMPDDFDPLRVDFALIPGVTIQKPWSIRPLIISAGSDGQFGIALQASNAGFRYNIFSPPNLTLMTWPLTPDAMGTELPGRTAPTIFVDPFLRQFPAVTRPGSPIAGADSLQADNITNYQLVVSE